MPNQFILAEEAQAFELSNDAFFYLLMGEEPLDEVNLEEALDIITAFPEGFLIDDDWVTIDTTGKIACNIRPYLVEVPGPEVSYDAKLSFTKYIDVYIKYIGTNELDAYTYNLQTKKLTALGRAKIRINNFGHKYFYTGPQDIPFKTGQSSMFFLKSFSNT